MKTKTQKKDPRANVSPYKDYTLRELLLQEANLAQHAKLLDKMLLNNAEQQKTTKDSLTTIKRALRATRKPQNTTVDIFGAVHETYKDPEGKEYTVIIH